MKKKEILRLGAVYIIAVWVIFFNGFKAAGIRQMPKAEQSPEENLSPVTENEKNDEQEERETETEEQAPETKEEVSAAAGTGAVKGEIITRYISPYTAPDSYDGVYLKNSTDTNIEIKKLLNDNLSFKIFKKNEPEVLIVHTHATETYMETDSEYYYEGFTSRTTDNQKNMVKIGSIIAEKLNNAGIVTLHSQVQHDYPQYNGSYNRAAETIYSYLEKYPSIKVVLDLHRDAITQGETGKVKLVTEVEGKKAAQVMIVMGSQTGSVQNFPNWQENLKLALRLQQTIESKYPTLARPLSLMSKSYNQSITNGSLLIEFGTDANSLEEAAYSAELVGESLIALFNNLS